MSIIEAKHDGRNQMKYVILSLLFAGCLLAPGFSQTTAAVSQASFDLDLATAVKMALEHSYAVKETMVDFQTAKTMFQTAWSTFYPSSSFSASLSTNNTGTKLGAGVNLGLGLGASKIFYIQSAGNDFETAQITLNQTKAQLTSQVKKYYWSLVLYARQLGMLESQKDAEARRLETVKARYDLGLVSEIDMLQAEYEYKSQLVEFQSAQNTYNTNMLQFTQALGINRTTRVNLTDSIPEINGVDADFSAYGMDKTVNNPELKLLGLSYQAVEIAKNNIMSGLFPTLSLGMSVSWAFNRDPFSDPLFDAEDWSSSPGFSLSVSVPLDCWLPYSQTQTSLLKQDAVLQKLAYSIQEKQESVQREVMTLMLDLAQIETQIQSLDVNVALAQKNLALVEQLYENGRKNLLEVKDARNSMTTASVKLVQARLAYLSDILDLEYLLGIDLGI
ncbi:MAG: TolC family protein [Spirochaetaceae bacterium]|nr:MAG: TolC family protein [Spirochaetaceae bacterium]